MFFVSNLKLRSCKRVFYSILTPRKLKEEFIQTIFNLVEQSSNARPFIPVGTEPNELEALAPIPFLVEQHSVSFPSVATDDHFDHCKRFLRAQAYDNAIWTR